MGARLPLRAAVRVPLVTANILPYRGTHIREDPGMAFLRMLAAMAGVLGLATKTLGRGVVATGRGLGRGVRGARHRGGAGEPGMMRLLDLHASSIAGDTLVAIGLAGTIFFSVPAGEARGRVAWYLIVTMLPFAVLAPVVGPVLDRFRHGRRYALAVTFLGRGFLAYLISDNLDTIALYPAAFGVLVLSRAYGVARSAAVPRLLPRGLGLSEANARASAFGTMAGAVAAPVGILLAATAGQQWPLRLALVMFGYGMVTALRLPPRADSEPPETVPRVLQLHGRKGARLLSAPVVVATLIGTATLRGGCGFLTLYLAFSIRSGDLELVFLGNRVRETAAIGFVAGGLGVGSFLATGVGTVLRIHRPAPVQAVGLMLATAAACVAAWWYTLPWVTLLCVVAAAAAGLAKLTLDSAIQERTDDNSRASAFAHAETLLMVAWVAGGGIGLVPFAGRWGMAVLVGVLALGTAKAMWSAATLRGERLTGAARTPSADATAPPPGDTASAGGPPSSPGQSASRGQPAGTDAPRRRRRRFGRGRGRETGTPDADANGRETGTEPGVGDDARTPTARRPSNAGRPSQSNVERLSSVERLPSSESTSQPDLIGDITPEDIINGRVRTRILPTSPVSPAPVVPFEDDEDEGGEPPRFHLYRPSSLRDND